MKKILLYFVLFGLNFVTVPAAAINLTDMNSIQKELKECDRLCSLGNPKSKIEGYLRSSACYLNQAINLSKNDSYNEVQLNKILDKAASDFVRAKMNKPEYTDIDRYFSKKLTASAEENSNFSEYVTNCRITECYITYIRDAMRKCYLTAPLEPITDNAEEEPGDSDCPIM